MKEFNPSPEAESIVSVTDRVTKVALDAPATAVHFLGDMAVFVGAENGVTFAEGASDPKMVPAQIAGILCSASDGKRVLLGGDDGKLVSVDAKGVVETLATDAKRLCFGRMSGGDPISPYTGLKGEVKQMAFSPDGKRLAVAYADDTLAILGLVPPRPKAIRFNEKVEPAKWVELLTIPVSGVRGVEFSPNGTALAVSNPQGVVVLGAWK